MNGRVGQPQSALRALTDQVPTSQRDSILVFGECNPAVDDEFVAHARDVVLVSGHDALTLQLDRRFHLVVIGLDVLAGHDDGHRRAATHSAVQHIDRGGHLVVTHEETHDALGDGFWTNDLRCLGSQALGCAVISLFRRGDRTTVHDLLFEARAMISRRTPLQLAQLLRGPEPPLVLDTRTHTDRERFGVIPTSVHVPRTVVEWHFDPANGYLHPAMRSFDQPLVLVCNGGYSSSLAAANLVRLGFTTVSDLIGGHTAWAAAGLPVAPPDHSHLDTPGLDGSAINQER